MTEYTATWAARLVSAFDASGVHRMCAPGDLASGEWLSDEARKAGAEITHIPVATERTIVDEAHIDCAGERIDGLPMFDSPPTSSGAVAGKLVACGEPGAVGYVELPPNAASIKGMSFESMRRESNHAAIVVATRVAGASLAPINAQYYDAPFGPPVLQVAGMHHAWFEEQVQDSLTVALTSLYRREPAQSFNVAARIQATASSSPIVVLTPRTGWWESTAERAGGLVAWLAGVSTAAALRQRRQLHRDVHAYATCGHELGHLGLKTLLTQETTLLRESVDWLHLGANLGCASNPALTLRASNAREADRMRELLVSEGYPAELIRIDPISNASGEARDVVEHGGRVLSLIGSNAHFHAASDRWPGNVNAPRVASIARAVSRWVAQHAGNPA